MYAHQVGAGQNGRSNGGGCSEESFLLRGLRQECLARGTDQNRVLHLGHVRETSQNFRVLLLALTESDTGIDNDREPVDTGAACAADGGVEILGDRQHHVRHRAELAPGFRGATHVVQDQAGIVLHDDLGEKWIPGETAGVVDDLSAVLNGEFGYFGLIGIDRNRYAQITFEALQNRDQAADLFGGGDARAARLGGFSANIDDVGALFFEFEGAGVGAVGILV